MESMSVRMPEDSVKHLKKWGGARGLNSSEALRAIVEAHKLENYKLQLKDSEEKNKELEARNKELESGIAELEKQLSTKGDS